MALDGYGVLSGKLRKHRRDRPDNALLPAAGYHDLPRVERDGALDLMHNIHQNQGDPFGSRWWDENAVWQDGAIMTAQPDGSFLAFVSKFSSQAAQTDDDGHPA